MVDTTQIIELTIDLDKAVKDTTDYKIRVDELKRSLELLKNSQDATGEEIAKATAEYQSANEQLRANEKVLKQLTGAQNEEAGTLEKLTARNAQLRLERQKLNLNTKEGAARLKEINAELNKNNETIKENSDDQKKQNLNVGNYKSALEGLHPAIGQVTTGTKLFGTAFKIALGPIVLIIAAFAALMQYFKRTEEGQNSLAKVTAVFGVILQNLMDIVGKVGGILFNAITKPKEAWEGFKVFLDNFVQFFKDTFGNVIGGYIDIWVGGLTSAFANVGLAWQKFKGVFVDNSKDIQDSQLKVDAANQKVKDGIDRIKNGVKTMGNAIVGAYNDAKDAISDFMDETNKEIALTKKIEDQKAALRKKERSELVNDAKDQMQIAQLREKISRKDIYDGEERIKMLDRVNEIIQNRQDDDLNIAKQKLQIHKQEIAMSDSNIEALDEESRLEAEVIKIYTANAETRRSLSKQRISAINEIKEEEKKLAEAAVANLEFELKKFEATNEGKYQNAKFLTQKLVDEEKTRQQQVYEFEKAIIEKRFSEGLSSKLEHDTALLDLDIAAKEQQRAVEQEWADIKLQDAITAEQLRYDTELLLAQESIFAQLELEAEANEQRKQADLDLINELAINEEQKLKLRQKINQKYAKAEVLIEKTKTKAKLALAGGFAENIATIAGEQTAIGKAAAVAATTISTFQGATAAFTGMTSSIPGPVGIGLGIAAAAAAVVSGLANVKKILAVKSGLPGDSAGGGGVPSAGTPMAAPGPLPTGASPTIGQGIVSRDTVDTTGQMKTAFSEALNETPVKTAVVVDQVTAAQTTASNNEISATI